MSTRLLMLVLLSSLAMGCGDTWGRQSAVEVPLHRDLMGLNSRPAQCHLEKEDLEAFCNEENYHKLCPPGCPLWTPPKKR